MKWQKVPNSVNYSFEHFFGEGMRQMCPSKKEASFLRIYWRVDRFQTTYVKGTVGIYIDESEMPKCIWFAVDLTI